MPGLTRIRGIADTIMYLAEGTEYAMLIDTGCGVGDLASFVRTLTDKPTQVLITHGHMDHAMGARGFDRVYLSPLDREVYATHSRPEMQRAYPESLFSQGLPRPEQPILDSDWQEPLPFTSFLPLKPGDVFELGGLTVQVMEGAGHTPGCVTVLLPQLRVLILGDACNEFTFLFESCCPSVAVYREMLLRLQAVVEGRYDRVLFFHRSGEGAAEMIGGVLAVCEDVLAGRSERIPFEGFDGTQAAIARAMRPFPLGGRADGGVGNLVYDPRRLY